MELISKLIEIALVQCQDLGVIDWTPEDGAPESFYAECEIEFSTMHDWTPTIPGDFFVILCGVFCIIDAEYLTCWHASKIGEEL